MGSFGVGLAKVEKNNRKTKKIIWINNGTLRTKFLAYQRAVW